MTEETAATAEATTETQTAPETTQSDHAEQQQRAAETLYPEQTGDETPETASTEETVTEEPEAETETEETPPEEEDGAPETYEFNAPEGMPELDSAVTDALAEQARELNLTNSQAQSLVDRVFPVLQARAEENRQAMIEGWREESKKDPEIGGSNADETERRIALFRDQYGSEALVELMDQGIGDHPEIRRAFAKAGADLSEDTTFMRGTGGHRRDPKDPTVRAATLYPNANPG